MREIIEIKPVKRYWIMANEGGRVMTDTLAYLKKTCMLRAISGTNLSKDDLKRLRYKPVRVNVYFEIVNDKI